MIKQRHGDINADIEKKENKQCIKRTKNARKDEKHNFLGSTFLPFYFTLLSDYILNKD